ncbi:MAG: hypothetical protein AAGC68_05410 [Verrucomicrobiota bacterium]
MSQQWNVFRSVLFLALVCLLIEEGSAQSITIANLGFEVDTLPGGQPIPENTIRVDPSTPSDWDIYDPNFIIDGGSNSVGIINPTNSSFYSGGAPEGSQAALIYLEASGQGEAGIHQTLASSLQLQTRYTLQVDVGNPASGTSSSSSSGGAILFNFAGFPGYRIDLLAATTVIASDTGASIPDGSWDTRTLVVDIGDSSDLAGETLSVRLVSLNQTGTSGEPGIQVNFDHVRLVTSPVPEVTPVAADSALKASLTRKAKKLTKKIKNARRKKQTKRVKKFKEKLRKLKRQLRGL